MLCLVDFCRTCVHDNGEYPGHSKNLNYIVSYLFKEHVGNVE